MPQACCGYAVIDMPAQQHPVIVQMRRTRAQNAPAVEPPFTRTQIFKVPPSTALEPTPSHPRFAQTTHTTSRSTPTSAVELALGPAASIVFCHPGCDSPPSPSDVTSSTRYLMSSVAISVKPLVSSATDGWSLFVSAQGAPAGWVPPDERAGLKPDDLHYRVGC